MRYLFLERRVLSVIKKRPLFWAFFVSGAYLDVSPIYIDAFRSAAVFLPVVCDRH